MLRIYPGLELTIKPTLVSNIPSFQLSLLSAGVAMCTTTPVWCLGFGSSEMAQSYLRGECPSSLLASWTHLFHPCIVMVLPLCGRHGSESRATLYGFQVLVSGNKE